MASLGWERAAALGGCAFAVLYAIIFVGFLVFLVWVLAVSVSLWSHGRAEKATAVTA
jgi:hypothetical protein